MCVGLRVRTCTYVLSDPGGTFRTYTLDVYVYVQIYRVNTPTHASAVDACQDTVFVLSVRVPDLTHCPLTPFPSSPPHPLLFSAEGYVDTDVKLQKILAGILAAQTV
jgi:hypothetical protein